MALVVSRSSVSSFGRRSRSVCENQRERPALVTKANRPVPEFLPFPRDPLRAERGDLSCGRRVGRRATLRRDRRRQPGGARVRRPAQLRPPDPPPRRRGRTRPLPDRGRLLRGVAAHRRARRRRPGALLPLRDAVRGRERAVPAYPWGHRRSRAPAARRRPGRGRRPPPRADDEDGEERPSVASPCHAGEPRSDLGALAHRGALDAAGPASSPADRLLRGRRGRHAPALPIDGAGGHRGGVRSRGRRPGGARRRPPPFRDRVCVPRRARRGGDRRPGRRAHHGVHRRARRRRALRAPDPPPAPRARRGRRASRADRRVHGSRRRRQHARASRRAPGSDARRGRTRADRSIRPRVAPPDAGGHRHPGSAARRRLGPVRRLRAAGAA